MGAKWERGGSGGKVGEGGRGWGQNGVGEREREPEDTD